MAMLQWRVLCISSTAWGDILCSRSWTALFQHYLCLCLSPCRLRARLIQRRHAGCCGLVGEVQGPADDGDLIFAQVPPKPILCAVYVQHGLQLRPPEQRLQAHVIQGKPTSTIASCKGNSGTHGNLTIGRCMMSDTSAAIRPLRTLFCPKASRHPRQNRSHAECPLLDGRHGFSHMTHRLLVAQQGRPRSSRWAMQ